MQQAIEASDDVQEMRKKQKISLQQQEQMLLQMQHEIQVQLQNLYAEQHRLESPNDDTNDIGYEYPSYCANCLGDTFESTNKNLLSSEYSRKVDGTNKAAQSENELNQLSDHKRLEAIKQQILLKLNLREKPNITNSIPKQFILDTLHRAGERDFEYTTMMMQSSAQSMMASSDDPIVERLQQLRRNNSENSFSDEKDFVDDESEFDDFYGKTREIITFAERGQRINSHHILTFSTAYDNQTQPNAKLKIRMATLWIMVEVQPSSHKMKRESVHDERLRNDRMNVNPIDESFRHNQAPTKRRKRRKKDSLDKNEKNLYFQYDNPNFNSHISNNNNNDDNNNNKNNNNNNNSYKNYNNYNDIQDTMSKNNNKNNNNDNHIINSNSYDNIEWHDGQQKPTKDYNDPSLRDSLRSVGDMFGNFTQISTNNNNNHYRHKHKSHNNITLWIFRVRDTNQTNLNSAAGDNKVLSDRMEYSTSKEISLSKLGWQKIDVTSLVQKFYEDSSSRTSPETSMQLLIDCTGCIRKNLKIHLLQENDEMESTKPFLVVHIEPNIVRRTRRRAIDCSLAGKSQCCKQRFYVSFKTLGWDDWIIAPPGYYANYCRGDCGNGIHRTPDTLLTYYSHVFHEVRKYNKLNGNQLCCAPLKFSSMSLIYFDPDGKIIKRDLPKMVVDECGCP
ncbi:inhibin beta chain-like [Chironomus tepperi]|uniref:inhibin beta chain-like n=2 Tax=Chironomus tepperi TaxID=113505 RepID=UPI00391F5DF3